MYICCCRINMIKTSVAEVQKQNAMSLFHDVDGSVGYLFKPAANKNNSVDYDTLLCYVAAHFRLQR